MSRELDPTTVAARLQMLRASYAPETLYEARLRLAREQPSAREPLERAAARRLAELRALCELARHLHGR
jgi:hypothetical protein